jgi:DNA-binding GntR family transcriptional regulator
VQKPKFSDSSVPKTREEYVADHVRDAILRGELPPGERLDETSIAALLKVSRTPVRSALRNLAAEGLVEVYPHRGALVSGLSTDELEEVYHVREMLEGSAARLAAPNVDAQRLALLESTLSELEETTDPNSWLELNNRFHDRVYEAAHRPRMLSIIEYVRNIATPNMRVFIDSPGFTDSSNSEHRRILDACAKGDGDLAQAEVQNHLRSVCATTVRFTHLGKPDC